MKNFKNRFSVIVLVIALVVSFSGPSSVLAATTPSLGVAGTFGVLADTFTRNSAVTAIVGDLGYTSLSGGGSHTLTGSTFVGGGSGDATYQQAGIDQGTALTSLSGQACTFTFPAGAVNLSTDTTHGQIGVYTPGVYCTTSGSAASIGTAGILFSGPGTYIFRIDGALTTVNNSNAILGSGVSSCNIFWTATSATTLGSNTNFSGTIIDSSGITIGNSSNFNGQALAFGGTVTSDTDSISPTCVIGTAATPSVGSNNNTITVIKQIINDNGGTAVTTDFPLFINGHRVISGESVALAPGFYTITETNLPGYVRTFTGNCDVNGVINHGGVNTHNDVCTIVNDDIGVSSVLPPPLIDVLKTASPLSLPNGAGNVLYTYTLRNTGTVPVTGVTMLGDTCSPLARISGDLNNDNKLDLNEVWVYTCNTFLSATHTNTVVATGYANGFTAVDVASATVVVGQAIIPPLIHITKVPSTFILPLGAGNVIYSYTVTNPGTVALSNVNITDDKCTGLPGRVIGHPGDLNHNNLLENTESWSFTCQSYLTQTTTNTAIVSGTANGLTATDFALATVVVSVPVLPKTGFPPKETNIFLITLFSVAVLSYLVLLNKKEIV